MASAESVARYFLHLASLGEEPSPVTHLQLQKLMYYAQGWSLAMRGRPLFAGHIEAWEHGPVVKSLFAKFAKHGKRPIPQAEAAVTLQPDDRALVEAVWLRYGRYAAWRLRELTHAEPPWKEARGDLPEDAPSKSVITGASMKRYFRGLHEAHCRRLGMDPADLATSIGDARSGNVTPMPLPPGRTRVVVG